MRSKKITAVIVIAIVAITTLNVNIMLEDSAIDTFLTLNLSEKLALGEDTGSGASGEKGPMEFIAHQLLLLQLQLLTIILILVDRMLMAV